MSSTESDDDDDMDAGDDDMVASSTTLSPAPVSNSGVNPLDDNLSLKQYPSYEDQQPEFSLNNGKFPKQGCGKVGCDYVIISADGRIEIMDETRFRKRHKHWACYSTDDKGKLRKESFIEKWMTDEKMDRVYLSEADAHKAYYWDCFGMYPKKGTCPDNEFNLWPGFEADKMSNEYNPEVRAGLKMLMEHSAMLCSGNADQYKFLLDLKAHIMQHPEKKVGIMICLVGPQGCGKTTDWEIIQRVVGVTGAFTTEKPDQDVYGKFNSQMKHAYLVRFAEADPKKFKHEVGAIKAMITDRRIRIEEKYQGAINVDSYARFFLDTNDVNAIPDEHGERRFFIIQCSEIKDRAYWNEIYAHMKDDRVVRAFYDFLKARTIKEHYFGTDIPLGQFQTKLRDANRSLVDRFIAWFVEDQDLNANEMKLTSDEVFEEFKRWQEHGSEFDRSKSSVTRELSLKGKKGVKQTKEYRMVEDPKQPDQQKNKQVRIYTFDLRTLREEYRIAVDDEAAPVAELEAIDCEADICAWEAKRDAEAAVAVVGEGEDEQDQEEESDEESEDENEGVEESGREEEDENEEVEESGGEEEDKSEQDQEEAGNGESEDESVVNPLKKQRRPRSQIVSD